MVVYVDGKPIFVQNSKAQTENNILANRSSANNSDNDLNTRTKPVKSEKNSKSKSYISKKNANNNNNNNGQSNKSSVSNRPVAKIPYLLAAAAAAAASNYRQQQQQHQQNINNHHQQQHIQIYPNSKTMSLNDSSASCSPLLLENNMNVTTPTALMLNHQSEFSFGVSSSTSSNFKKDFKQDQEYIQLVSMFKQKNEKLFNPLKL
jgi:hypothetical protein